MSYFKGLAVKKCRSRHNCDKCTICSQQRPRGLLQGLGSIVYVL